MKQKYQILINNFKSFIRDNNIRSWVLGLSWWVDSALTLAIWVEVLWKNNIKALLMPDDQHSSDDNFNDAKVFAESLDVDYEIVNISNYLETFKLLPWKANSTADMNIRARIRMLILYHYANTNSSIVLWTWNKTELILWYWTKYWDFWVDVEIIWDLYKTEVWAMAKYLWLPNEFITKKPTAELGSNQTDEDEIWFSYEKIDNVIMRFEKWEKIEDKYLSLMDRINKNKHKSQIIPTIRAN